MLMERGEEENQKKCENLIKNDMRQIDISEELRVRDQVKWN